MQRAPEGWLRAGYPLPRPRVRFGPKPWDLVAYPLCRVTGVVPGKDEREALNNAFGRVDGDFSPVAMPFKKRQRFRSPKAGQFGLQERPRQVSVVSHK